MENIFSKFVAFLNLLFIVSVEKLLNIFLHDLCFFASFYRKLYQLVLTSTKLSSNSFIVFSFTFKPLFFWVWLLCECEDGSVTDIIRTHPYFFTQLRAHSDLQWRRILHLVLYLKYLLVKRGFGGPISLRLQWLWLLELVGPMACWKRVNSLGMIFNQWEKRMSRKITSSPPQVTNVKYTSHSLREFTIDLNPSCKQWWPLIKIYFIGFFPFPVNSPIHWLPETTSQTNTFSQIIGSGLVLAVTQTLLWSKPSG